MKISKVLSLMTLTIGMNALASNVPDVMKEKSFGIYKFNRCVIEVDHPSRFVYANILNTTMSISLNTITLHVNGEKFQKKLSDNDKNAFVAEYIYRQNYCTLRF